MKYMVFLGIAAIGVFSYATLAIANETALDCAREGHEMTSDGTQCIGEERAQIDKLACSW